MMHQARRLQSGSGSEFDELNEPTNNLACPAKTLPLYMTEMGDL